MDSLLKNRHALTKQAQKRTAGRWPAIALPFFFGNYFIGLLATALSVETALQLGIPLQGWAYYVFLFSIIVVYYSYAYSIGVTPQGKGNPRSNWYLNKQHYVLKSQCFFLSLALAAFAYFAYQNDPILLNINYIPLFTLIFTLLLALLYYDTAFLPFSFHLRRLGWAKCFLIGFIWANTVTLLPLILYQASAPGAAGVPYPSLLWFYINNFMFCTVNALLFDIKDYDEDSNKNLKTLVVRMGQKKVLTYFVLPLTLLGILAMLLFSLYRDLAWPVIALHLLPFAALLGVAFSLHKPRSILYYLVIIDGLLLLKAGCGILAAHL